MSSPKGAVTFLGSEDRREAEKVDPYDNMIEALATNRADVAFHVGILPGAPRRCDHFFHPHGSGEGGELCAIDRVTIAQQISWHFTNGEEEEVHLTKVMPFLVEDELLQYGAVFEKAANWQPFFCHRWPPHHRTESRIIDLGGSGTSETHGRLSSGLAFRCGDRFAHNISTVTVGSCKESACHKIPSYRISNHCFAPSTFRT